ncbi:hypothetical protein FRB98_005167 [Tulasnella sp. 332]|nr:hypothetical protein FRB98_005167 [Tulasnella sp. 332]
MSDWSQAPLDSEADELDFLGSDNTLPDSDLEGLSKPSTRRESKPYQSRIPCATSRPSIQERPSSEDYQDSITPDSHFLDDVPRLVECRWNGCWAKLASVAILRRHIKKLHVDAKQGQRRGSASTQAWHTCRYGSCANQSFPKLVGLSAHICSHHLVPLRLTCTIRGCKGPQKDSASLRNHLRTAHDVDDSFINHISFPSLPFIPPLSSTKTSPTISCATPLTLAYLVALPKISASQTAQLVIPGPPERIARDIFAEDPRDDRRSQVKESGHLELSPIAMPNSGPTPEQPESKEQSVPQYPFFNDKYCEDEIVPPSTSFHTFNPIRVVSAPLELPDVAPTFATVKGLRRFWDLQFRDSTASAKPQSQWASAEELWSESKLASIVLSSFNLEPKITVKAAPRLKGVSLLLPPTWPRTLPRKPRIEVHWVDNHILIEAVEISQIPGATGEVKTRAGTLSTNTQSSRIPRCAAANALSGASAREVASASTPSTFGFEAFRRWHAVATNRNTVVYDIPTLSSDVSSISAEAGTRSAMATQVRGRKRPWMELNGPVVPPLVLRPPNASAKKIRFTL